MSRRIPDTGDIPGSLAPEPYISMPFRELKEMLGGTRFTLKEEIVLRVIPLLVEDTLKTSRADEAGIENMIGRAANNIADAVLAEMEKSDG